MAENISTISFGETVSGGAKILKAIGVGGLTVGVLDGIAASMSGVSAGTSPAIVWQYVASGLLGKSSYGYGWKSVLLRLLIHFFIAFTATAIYFAASRRFPMLTRQAVVFGTIYGIAVYFVMGYVVTPLSAAAKLPFSISSTVIGLLIYVFCFGLPIALITRRFAKNDRENRLAEK
jgi:hypothetical protein